VVLDAGAGRGRFTVELARLGAKVHVGDISPTEVELNRRHVTEAGHAAAVVASEVLDVCDLSRFDTGQFDGVVCFGGPLSYVRSRADLAMGELVRVSKPGGYVLLSVMSTLGAMRAFLPSVIDEDRRFGAEHTEGIFTTGDLERATNGGHEMHMFRWSELAALCEGHGEIVSVSAANYLTAGQPLDLLNGLSPTEWERLVSLELRLCREPGVLDAGTHIVVALRTPA